MQETEGLRAFPSNQGGGFIASESLKVDLNTNTLKNRPLTQSEQDWIRQQQAAQSLSAIPIHGVFVLCSLLAIGALVTPYVNLQAVRIWQVMAIVPVFLFAGLIIRAKRKPSLLPSQIIHYLEAVALMEGLIFLIPAAVLIPDLPESQKVALYGATLLLAAIAAVSLVRIPIAAIVVSTLLVGGCFVSMLLVLSNLGIVHALTALAFGLILNGIIINLHWEFINRTNAEVEINRQKQLVSLLLNDFERGSTDWLWETDKESRLVYFSPRMATAFGKSEDEIRGKRFSDLVPEASKVEGWAAFEGALSRRANVPGIVLPYFRESGAQYWHVTARILRGLDGEFAGFRGVGRDITEKWRTDMADRAARDSALHASARKNNFISVVSHEIRTPINAIVGYSELLASSNDAHASTERRKEYLANVITSARQLQGLVADVLDSTMLERGGIMLKDQDVDGAELIETAINAIATNIEAQNISVVANLLDGVALSGDAERLRQIIGNLLDNAVKFSTAGGIVHVEIQKGRGAEFVLSIRDAGIGMSEAEIARVFESFVQADQSTTRRFGGLGLGLSIARRLAVLHGGDLVLKSTPGVGTEARFILPPSRVRWPHTIERAA